jgi:hypothetical protein
VVGFVPCGDSASGIDVLAIPDCGHNIMLDNKEGFAIVVKAALLD